MSDEEEFPNEKVVPLALERAREQLRVALVAQSAARGRIGSSRVQKLSYVIGDVDECLQWGRGAESDE